MVVYDIFYCKVGCTSNLTEINESQNS
uniref:Uncharacterized protein n=1 Tax=Rhizophora mucronata TaxID=61149 RepID=A0A2P2IQI5_RHIMU